MLKTLGIKPRELVYINIDTAAVPLLNMKTIYSEEDYFTIF